MKHMIARIALLPHPDGQLAARHRESRPTVVADRGFLGDAAGYLSPPLAPALLADEHRLFAIFAVRDKQGQPRAGVKMHG